MVANPIFDRELTAAPKNPINASFLPDCASADMHSAMSMALANARISFFIDFYDRPSYESLPDNFIRSRQHIGRNRQADLFGGFQIDH